MGDGMCQAYFTIPTRGNKSHAHCKQNNYATIWALRLSPEVDCAWGQCGQDKKWNPMRGDLRGCRTEPIPRNVTHISPLSVACFPHRRGRDGGKRSAIMMWKTHESTLEKYCMKNIPTLLFKYNHPLSSKRKKYSSENLKEWWRQGCRCWHNKKY